MLAMSRIRSLTWMCGNRVQHVQLGSKSVEGENPEFDIREGRGIKPTQNEGKQPRFIRFVFIGQFEGFFRT